MMIYKSEVWRYTGIMYGLLPERLLKRMKHSLYDDVKKVVVFGGIYHSREFNKI